MNLPTKTQSATLKRFIETNEKFDELEMYCEVDDYLKVAINRAVINLEMFENLDSDDHPEVIDLRDKREQIRSKIRAIIKRHFGIAHPIHQVFDIETWTGKQLINSMIDFSEPDTWE